MPWPCPAAIEWELSVTPGDVANDLIRPEDSNSQLIDVEQRELGDGFDLAIDVAHLLGAQNVTGLDVFDAAGADGEALFVEAAEEHPAPVDVGGVVGELVTGRQL